MGFGGFSWKRAVGISKAKSKISKGLGVPLTKGGRQRKLGKAVGGCCVVMIIALTGLALSASLLSTAAHAEEKKETVKSDLVYVTPKGKKYHLETCRYIVKAKEDGKKLESMTKEEARKRKLTPCKVCKPDEASGDT